MYTLICLCIQAEADVLLLLSQLASTGVINQTQMAKVRSPIRSDRVRSHAVDRKAVWLCMFAGVAGPRNPRRSCLVFFVRDQGREGARSRVAQRQPTVGVAVYDRRNPRRSCQIRPDRSGFKPSDQVMRMCHCVQGFTRVKATLAEEALDYGPKAKEVGGGFWLVGCQLAGRPG